MKSEIKTVADLLFIYRTQRILLEMYWRGLLDFDEERIVEDNFPPELRIGMKPIAS